MPEDREKSEDVELCFGRIALARGLVTSEQLEYCQRLREENKTIKGLPRMGEIMMKEGLITKPQALDILKAAHIELGDNQKIGGYELIDKLGEGAMGAVYKAKQLSMDRIVALKLLPRSLSNNKNILDRFLREARIVANLNHPNIVRGFEIGEANGYHYFAMEFVDGGTIGGRIRKEKRIPENDCIEIALQCCRALQHAHDAGVVHRDIKPDNLMLTSENHVKVADLGLATREDTQSLTATGNTVGTPYYMAPEQVTAEIKLDGRADIYALGASLYHMVTGEPPFTGASTPAIMSKRLMNDPVAPCNIHSDVSKSFSAVLMKMMTRELKKRYQDCNSVISDMEKVKSGQIPSCFNEETDSMLKTKTPDENIHDDLTEDEIIELNEIFESSSSNEILPAWITPLRVLVFMCLFFTVATATWFFKNRDKIFSPSHPDGKVWEFPAEMDKNINKNINEDWQTVLKKITIKNNSKEKTISVLDEFIAKYPSTALAKRAEMFKEDVE